MRPTRWLVLISVAVGGCTLTDENVGWNPKTEYPDWTFDAPFYYRPSKDLEPVETVGPGIQVYYTNKEYFFVKHPDGYQLTSTPRVQVWSSTDRGGTWEREGCFGVEQTHFLFQADAEGTYFIRFVGPSQAAAKASPAAPHRIYVVDMTPPQITVSVKPSPWEDDGKSRPRLYRPGQIVIVSWSVRDLHLDPNSLRLGMCFARFPHNMVWADLPKSLPVSGSEKFRLLPGAGRKGGVRFRVEAADKAGNVNFALSDVLHVSSAPPAKPKVPAAGTVAPRQGAPREQTLAGPPPAATIALRDAAGEVIEWMPQTPADLALLAPGAGGRPDAAAPAPVGQPPAMQVRSAAAPAAGAFCDWVNGASEPIADVLAGPRDLQSADDEQMADFIKAFEAAAGPPLEEDQTEWAPVGSVLAWGIQRLLAWTPGAPARPALTAPESVGQEGAPPAKGDDAPATAPDPDGQDSRIFEWVPAAPDEGRAEIAKPDKAPGAASLPPPGPASPPAAKAVSASRDGALRWVAKFREAPKQPPPPGEKAAKRSKPVVRPQVAAGEKASRQPEQKGITIRHGDGGVVQWLVPAPRAPAAAIAEEGPRAVPTTKKQPPARNVWSLPMRPTILTKIDKPGWPLAGVLIHGGAKRVLKWMPEFAKDYGDLRLQFSANDGRTWRTVASGFVPGRPVKWTVPPVTTRMARLRIVGTAGAGDQAGQVIMLAKTRKFSVATVLPDTILGPVPVRQQAGKGEPAARDEDQQ